MRTRQDFFISKKKADKKTFGNKVKNMYFKKFFDENALGEIH